MKLTILLQDTAMGSSDDSARGLYSLWKTAGKGSGGLHVGGAVIKEIIITREENDTDGALMLGAIMHGGKKLTVEPSG